MAFLIPCALVLLCFVKKLTVIGIIGNTQGVNSAASPLAKDRKKITQIELLLSSSFVLSFLLSLFLTSLASAVSTAFVSALSITAVFVSKAGSGIALSTFALTLAAKGKSKGGKHWFSSHV